MHELSICQALMDQVEQIAIQQNASRVERIVLQVGPLSGVEPTLLQQAFPLASAGSVAADSQLEIKLQAVEVRCSSCGQHSTVRPNKLVCTTCGDWRTELVSGDEMLLERVELACETQETGATEKTESLMENGYV